MQHGDRQRFIGSLLATVEGLYGSALASEPHDALRQRLETQLDAFLLEARPVAPTQATVLIADIRGFTSLTESLPAPVLSALLNRFFARMAALVLHYRGVIDKFMGDAVMALFGLPEPRADDLPRALRCAVAMQRAMPALNRMRQSPDEPELQIGIGISSGSLMAGSFGSRIHNEYTVIGDPVNLAARIEGYSLRGQILLSETSYLQVRDDVEIGTVNEVAVKGKSGPVRLYELRAITRPRRLEAPRIEARRSPRIQVDFPMIARRIENKRVLPEPFAGRVSDLGYQGLSAELPLILPPCSEILVALTPALGVDAAVEVYARVLRASLQRGHYHTCLEFTAVDTPGHRRVKQYVDQRLWGR